jgi:Concanavalin A-like lectin/glucanases superfamily
MSYINGPQVVTNNLIMCVDALNPRSYSSGSTWYDLTTNSNNNFTKGGSISVPLSSTPTNFFDFTSNAAFSANNAFYGSGFGTSSTIVPLSGSFTLEAWINRNNSINSIQDRETIFSNTGNANGWRFGIYSSGILYYLIGGNGGGYSEGGVGSGYNVGDGKWHQVGLVFDRSAILGSYSVYSFVDGVIKGSVSISTGNETMTVYYPGIGYGGCCVSYAGYIARVSAYNTALTPTLIYQNFNALRGRFGI